MFSRCKAGAGPFYHRRRAKPSEKYMRTRVYLVGLLALAVPSGDYTVFTHLIDGEGRIWGQKGNVPVEGWYPTSLWDPGEVVRDPYLLPIDAATPPGTYRIEVGMYDPSSGRRLEVFKEPGVSEGGRILLPFEVAVMRSPDD